MTISEQLDEPIRSIDFDVNNRFLILVGSKSLGVINILDKSVKQEYMLNTTSYQMIEAIRFISTSETEYQCNIAALKTHIK